MSTHRLIATSFWDDEWVSTLDPSEKLMYIYLLSNPLANLAGVYKITNKRICFDTGFNNDTVSHIIGKFENARKAYRKGEYVVLPNCPKHQKLEVPTIRKGIISILQDLPEEIFIFLEEVGYCFDLSTVETTIISRKTRKGISGTTQKLVYEKCNNQCSECGTNENLHIHHIVAIEDGGDNKIDNLILLCEDCYKKKNSPHTLCGIHIVPVESTEFNLIKSNLIKENLNKENSNSEASPPDVSKPSPQKSENPKKLSLRDREPKNDMERVEKAYLKNWDALYSQKRVITADPVVNWNQTRKLLKSHFEKLKPDEIIQAINNGLKDDFIMYSGYTLGTMLSASVLNRLLNTNRATPPLGLTEKESLTGLKSIF